MICEKCGALKCELGSEPTPEQFVANLVAVFRDVRRVLHPSGVLICNLGDSYSGSGKGKEGPNALIKHVARQGFDHGGRAPVSGLPPKNLMQMPARVALALQADGWYLRSVMPWLKRAAMPESVTDRPSNALEWLFLFSKAPKYFWDHEAVRQAAIHEGYLRKGCSPAAKLQQAGDSVNDRRTVKDFCARDVLVSGRAFRNTDPWFISLDSAIADTKRDLARLEAMRATGGVLADDDGLPLAVDINPAAYKEAHFATYPPALVVPFVKAGTSERGCCPRCLAPWTRVVERKQYGSWHDHVADETVGNRQNGTYKGAGWKDYEPPHSTGWIPGCACDAGEPIPCPECAGQGDQYFYEEGFDAVWRPRVRGVPYLDSRVCPTCHGRGAHVTTPPEPRACTVLDPFLGSGTTALCADRLGRDAIGIELSPEYARMAEARIAGDAPLWVDMAAVEATAGDYAPPGLFEEIAG